MAGRRARARRSSKRSRDLIWITTVVQTSLLESVIEDSALLVIPTDWVSTGGFDRATLLGIRGWLSIVQATVGTSADATMAAICIYKTDQATPAAQFDPLDATDYADFDTLFTDGICINATASPIFASRQLDIKTRRKLTSADSIRLAATMNSDTATPRFNVNGVVRCLLQLDPPR